jgi:hypothetical protein
LEAEASVNLSSFAAELTGGGAGVAVAYPFFERIVLVIRNIGRLNIFLT